MLFFEAQRKAHSRTGWLVFLFLFNTALISALNAGLVVVFLKWPPEKAVLIFAGSAIFFVLMSIFFTWNLPKGLALVQSLGGRLIEQGSTDFKEIQFVNVVEEMSLASGVPHPHCAVMDGEGSINAFVAGERLHDIVVTVTRGALDILTRDELQAVIGHEYSHILNEDLSFNGRLAGVVQGFQVITKLGDLMIDRRTNRSDYGDQVRGKGDLSLLGVGFLAVGAIGYFLGRLIQSSISQQREYLADASSAQYTRNPAALATALGKILMGNGSAVHSSSRLEFAHVFFSDALGSSFMSSFFATHPPLRNRIQRLVPRANIEDLLSEAVKPSAPEPSSTATLSPSKQKWTSEKVLQCIGAPNEANFALAQKLISDLGPAGELLKNPQVARAAFSLVVLKTQNNFQEGFTQAMESSDISRSDLTELRRLIEANEQSRMALFQRALGALRVLSFAEKQELLKSVKALFVQDQRWSLLEALLYLVAEKTLLPGQVNSSVGLSGAPAGILNWFQAAENVNFDEIKQNLTALDRIPLLKKKAVIEELLGHLEGQAGKQVEEFRLAALYLGVPIPMYQ